MADIFVSPEWLEEHRDDVHVVDVRNEWDYEEGHVPGAVNVPFNSFRSASNDVEGKLPTAETFGSLLSEAGVSPGHAIVAYDDEYGVYASRFLVTAEVFGHCLANLFVLDSDYGAWADDRLVSTEAPTTEPLAYSCERDEDDPVVSAAELEAALDTDAAIVDTRDPIEYDAVHLPGAINFQWTDLVDNTRGQLKPRDRCRDILADAGISLDRPVRLYCNTARRLSFVYAVLRELGHDDVAFYEGGIGAWSKYGGRVETS